MTSLLVGWRRAFSRRHIVTTVLVFLAVPVMVRLGFWQLDRLAQKRAFNAQVEAQIAAPAQPLRGPEDLAGGPDAWRFRHVVAEGEYDFSAQVAVRNRFWQGRPGFHLLAPLRLTGCDCAVMVDRGWIPQEQADPEQWTRYDEPGQVRVEGHLLEGEVAPNRGEPPSASGERLVYWADVEAIGASLPYTMLPALLLQEPRSPEETTGKVLPVREGFHPELSEGPHLGYAIQWFLFALLLPGGYLYGLARNQGRA